MSNPVINLSEIYNIFYNVQTVTVTNTDGNIWENVKAIRQPVKTDLVDIGGDGTMGQRTRCTWLFFKNTIPTGLIPQANTRIEDSNGTYWYVSKITNRYMGNIFTLETEARGGIGVENIQIPAGSTSTTTTTPDPTTCLLTVNSNGDTLAWSAFQEDNIAWTLCEVCSSNGEFKEGLEINTQQNGCITRITNGWHLDNLMLPVQGSSGMQILVRETISSLNIVADATLLTNGTALVLLNGSVYNANFAGELVNITISNPTVNDVWEVYFYTNVELNEGDVTAEFTSA